MKKIISLLMVAVMVFALALTSMAAETVTTGLNVVATEDADGYVTVTATLSGTMSVKEFVIGFNPVGLVPVNASTKAEIAAGSNATIIKTSVTSDFIDDTNWKYTTGAYLYREGMMNCYYIKVTSADGAAKSVTDKLIATMYFKKTGDYTFNYANGQDTMCKNYCATITGATSLKITDAANADYFGLKVVPYEAPAADKWETSAAPTGWTAPAALEGEVRRVAVFGKNATAKALGENEYGVTFGDNTYYGVATTDAVNAWAIVLVDTEGDLIKAGYEYTGTAFVGTTNWSVTVSAN